MIRMKRKKGCDGKVPLDCDVFDFPIEIAKNLSEKEREGNGARCPGAGGEEEYLGKKGDERTTTALEKKKHPKFFNKRRKIRKKRRCSDDRKGKVRPAGR